MNHDEFLHGLGDSVRRIAVAGAFVEDGVLPMSSKVARALHQCISLRSLPLRRSRYNDEKPICT